MSTIPAHRNISRSFSGLVTVLLAVSFMTGGPWFVLQTIAWGRMIVAYAHQNSFAIALKKTFDGRHPCALCLQISYGQQDERQKGAQSAREKLEKMPELFCDTRSIAVLLAPEANVAPPAFRPDHYSDFVESPPTPPPRVGAAVL